jgi:hypothetical protein
MIDGPSGEGNRVRGEQDPEFQSHLNTCPHCSELVSDLKLIASEARQLSDSEEPSPAVWLRIAAELRAEGLIREPELASARAVVLPAPRRRWNAFWLAPVAVAILASGSYLLTHKSALPNTAQVAKIAEPQPGVPGQQAATGLTPVPQTLVPQPPVPQAQVAQGETPHVPAPNTQSPKNQVPQAPESLSETAELSAPSGEDEQQFLSEVSTRAPSMRSTYENQLRAVDAEIRETKDYLARYPGDMDARQHLLEVYQQKAMLYQIALDRIQ